MSTALVLEAEVSTFCSCCSCSVCGVCSVGQSGEPCDYCTGSLVVDAAGDWAWEAPGVYVDARSCDGDCWEAARLDWEWLFGEWLTASGATFCKVQGSRLGWRGSRGESFAVRAEAGAVLDLLGISGEFVLRCSFDPATGELVAVRSSHDECGARLVVVPCEDWE